MASNRIAAGDPVSLSRGDLRWRMAVPEDGILPFDNCAPALIQWQNEIHPNQMLEPSGVRLTRLTVRHAEADKLCSALKRELVDDRIAFEVGPTQLHAEFQTAHGRRELGG